MAKRLPKPFVRPSISVGDNVKRDWTDVPAASLRRGDTVPEVGVLKSVGFSGDKVIVEGVSGAIKQFETSLIVKAFVVVSDER